MKENIKPVGLKGNEINERMKELMGITPINENRRSSVVELTKVGPDGHVYGIVRENHEYYIKITNKTKNLVAEDFSYIGGLKNKKQEAYGSYAKAIKHLNLKFNSLNEAYGKSGQINVFEDDNLMAEAAAGFVDMGNAFTNEAKSSCCGATIAEEKCSECGKSVVAEAEKKNNPWAICTSSVGREDKEKFEKCVKDVKKEKGVNETITESEFMGDDIELSEVEQKIEDMKEDKEALPPPPAEDYKNQPGYIGVTENHKLSIERAINQMDDIISSLVGESVNKKKVYTLK